MINRQDTRNCIPDVPDRFGKSPTFQVVKDENGCGCIDLVLNTDDTISTEYQIEHHVITRLGIRSKAIEVDDIQDCSDGGWWPSSLGEIEYGSRLWVYQGKPVTEENIALVESIIKEKLQEIIDLGIAHQIDISKHIDIETNSFIFDSIEVIQPNKTTDVSFAWLWER